MSGLYNLQELLGLGVEMTLTGVATKRTESSIAFKPNGLYPIDDECPEILDYCTLEVSPPTSLMHLWVYGWLC